MLEQRYELALVGTGTFGLIRSLGIEVAHRLPESRQGAISAWSLIPDARRDDTARLGHPRHLRDALCRVRHEMHDELGERQVEAVVRERQCLDHAALDVDLGQPLPNGRNERLGRVDRCDGSRAEAGHQLLGERSWPAAHVERCLTGAHADAGCEQRRQGYGEATHEPVVIRGGNLEAHGSRLAVSARLIEWF